MEIKPTQRMIDRRAEWRRTMETPEAIPAPKESSVEYQVTTVDEYDRITTVRKELTELIQEKPPVEEPTTITTEQVPEERGGVASILVEKELKRRILRQKESSPKRYDEKLLVISDLQLLREANDGGIGALIAYLKDQGRTFTTVVINGDAFDLTQQAGFRKDNAPGDDVSLDEQAAGKWFIRTMEEACPDAKKVFMKGNHEARYANMYLDRTDGTKQHLIPFEEWYGLENWEVHEYGNGDSYDWHGRKIRHGTRGGAVSNIPKIEMERNWKPTTVGHAIANRSWEFVNADGELFTSFVHSGFSKTAAYDKTGDKKPSNGFGVYYWTETKKGGVETAYQVMFSAVNPTFISPEGNVYSGEGFNLREEIGLDPKKPRRGRPRKS